MNIYIETEALKNKANDIKSIASQLNDNMNRIENLVMNLGIEWQGKSEIAYAAKILFVKKQYESLYDFLIDYSDTILSIVNDYEEAERQILSHLEV